MAEDTAGVVRRFYDDVISQGKLDLIDELVAPDFVEHQEFPGLEPNRDGLKKFFAMWRQAFPDARASIDLLAVQGDLAAVYGTWAGTHQGEFLGVPGRGASSPSRTPTSSASVTALPSSTGASSTPASYDEQLAIVPAMAAVGA